MAAESSSVAARIPEARAVATIAAPSDPRYVVDCLLAEHLDSIAKLGEARVSLAGRPFNIRQHFVEDAVQYHLAERIAALGRPLLVLHSPQDDTVAYANGELAQPWWSFSRQRKARQAHDHADGHA